MRGGGRRYANAVSVSAALIVWFAGIVTAVIIGPQGETRAVLVFLGSLLLGFFVLFAIKIANQWEKAIVLRFGKFRALRGPGLFFVIPVVDQTRISSTSACASPT